MKNSESLITIFYFPATDAGPFHPVNTTTDFNCSEGFEKVEEDREPVCRALCNGWNQVGDEWTTVITMVQALSISLAVLSSIAVYIVSCVRRKAMCVLGPCVVCEILSHFPALSVGGAILQST